MVALVAIWVAITRARERAFRARLPIDGRLATRDSADRQRNSV